MTHGIRRRLALVRRAAALTAAAAASFPAIASADDVAVAGGMYVSFVFGDQIGVGYGAEASMMGLVQGQVGSCGPRSGVGGLLQVGGINDSTLRLVAAAQGGGTILSDDGSPAIVGELGVAGHVLADDPGVGIHTGFLFDTGYFANLFFRSEFLLEEYSVGGGARFLGTFGPPFCAVDGRPLRDADGAVTPLPSAPVHAARESDHVRLARAWAADAQAECASIPAFLQLAMDLLAANAPEPLVASALDAAEDEIRHARACAAMASRWLARPFLPHLPAAPLRPARADLGRLAVESWLDGALGEGAAADRAAAAAARATDPRARAIRRRIAVDEARHAELGWRVLTWSLDRGGEEVAARVRARRDAELPPPASSAVDPRLGAAHGQLDDTPAGAISSRLAERARARLDRVLS